MIIQVRYNMNKISAVYKITNTITGDFYIGSSKDVKKRWSYHKKPSTWKRYSNNQLYKDMQEYGKDKFAFEVIAEVEADSLKEAEQQFIELLKPTYNDRNANGWDIERKKEYMKEYNKSDKVKEYQKEYNKEYHKTDKYKDYKKQYQKQYQKTDKYKESHKKANKEYQNQLCFYNGETLTLNALSQRFKRKGISHPTQEAKKYLL